MIDKYILQSYFTIISYDHIYAYRYIYILAISVSKTFLRQELEGNYLSPLSLESREIYSTEKKNKTSKKHPPGNETFKVVIDLTKLTKFFCIGKK